MPATKKIRKARKSRAWRPSINLNRPAAHLGKLHYRELEYLKPRKHTSKYRYAGFIHIDTTEVVDMTQITESRVKSSAAWASGLIVNNIKKQMKWIYQPPVYSGTGRGRHPKRWTEDLSAERRYPKSGTGYAWWSGAYKDSWRVKVIKRGQAISRKLLYVDPRKRNYIYQYYLMGAKPSKWYRRRVIEYVGFVEYGTSKMEARPVLSIAIRHARPESLTIINRHIELLFTDMRHRITAELNKPHTGPSSWVENVMTTYKYPNPVIAFMGILRSGIINSDDLTFSFVKVHDTHVPIKVRMDGSIDFDYPSIIVTLEDEDILWNNDGYAGVTFSRVRARVIGREKSDVSLVVNKLKETLDNYRGIIDTIEGRHSVQECRKISEMSEFLEEESFYDVHMYYGLCLAKLGD